MEAPKWLCRSIDQDFQGPIGVTEANGTCVGFVRRFKTNIFKFVAFQVFAVTVFARASDEKVLRSILKVLRSEISAEEQVSGVEKYANWITTCRPSDYENSAPCCKYTQCQTMSWNQKCKACYWECADTKCIKAKSYPRSIYASDSYYVAA